MQNKLVHYFKIRRPWGSQTCGQEQEVGWSCYTQAQESESEPGSESRL